MPANAEIGTKHPASTTALGGNVQYRGMEWRPRRAPESHVYLYNVSVRTFTKCGPYQNINIPGVTDSDPVLPGMAANQKYHYVTSFPQPMTLFLPKDNEGLVGVLEIDARRYIVDLINPNNLTLSLDTAIPPQDMLSVNNDLSVSGVFYSESNPPLKIEVEKAIARLEKRYKQLLEQAQTLELTDKAKLQSELGSNPDYAYAAEYYGVTVSWRKERTRPVICPNCGEQKNFGSKFHVNKELGFVCIEPTKDGWMAAYNAGVKTKEQVPEELRWWGKKSATDES